MQVRWKGAGLAGITVASLVTLSLGVHRRGDRPDDEIRQSDADAETAAVGIRELRGRPGPWCARHTEAGGLDRAAPQGVRLPGGRRLLLPGGGRRRATTASRSPSTWTRTARTSPTATWRDAVRRRTRSTSPRTITAPAHLLGSSNDYRRGDGGCFAYTARDNGRTCHDIAVPFGFTRGPPTGRARQYWAGGGDTSSAFDTRGNAYFSCQVFNRGSAGQPQPRPLQRPSRVPLDRQRRGVVHFPGRAVAENPDVDAAAGNGSPGQAAADRRQPRRQPVPRPGVRDLDDVRGRRHRLHLSRATRPTTRRPGARRSW